MKLYKPRAYKWDFTVMYVRVFSSLAYGSSFSKVYKLNIEYWKCFVKQNSSENMRSTENLNTITTGLLTWCGKKVEIVRDF